MGTPSSGETLGRKITIPLQLLTRKSKRGLTSSASALWQVSFAKAENMVHPCACTAGFVPDALFMDSDSEQENHATVPIDAISHDFSHDFLCLLS